MSSRDELHRNLLMATKSETWLKNKVNEVITTPQEYNEDQKAIARNNIDALDTKDICNNEFSDQSTYSVGDIVVYLNKLYRCKSDVSTAGEWDPNKWEEIDINSLIEIRFGDIVAHLYNSSSTYQKNSYVIHDSKLFRCNSDSAVTGDWDASKWTSVLLTDVFNGSAPGLVPAPAAGVAERFLASTGLWTPFDYATDSDIDDMFLDNVVKIGGRNYKTVTIGTQVWMAENLDYKSAGISIGCIETTEPNAGYYNNNEATYGINGNKYGLLYNGYAAHFLEQNKSTLFPDEWHIPNRNEMDTLISFIGGSNTAGSKLKSSIQWNGTDDYEFSMVPTGLYGYGGSYGFWDVGSNGYFWHLNSNALYLTSFDNNNKVNYYTPAGGDKDAVAIRLVKTLT